MILRLCLWILISTDTRVLTLICLRAAIALIADAMQEIRKMPGISMRLRAEEIWTKVKIFGGDQLLFAKLVRVAKSTIRSFFTLTLLFNNFFHLRRWIEMMFACQQAFVGRHGGAGRFVMAGPADHPGREGCRAGGDGRGDATPGQAIADEFEEGALCRTGSDG